MAIGPTSLYLYRKDETKQYSIYTPCSAKTRTETETHRPCALAPRPLFHRLFTAVLDGNRSSIGEKVVSCVSILSESVPLLTVMCRCLWRTSDTNCCFCLYSMLNRFDQSGAHRAQLGNEVSASCIGSGCGSQCCICLSGYHVNIFRRVHRSLVRANRFLASCSGLVWHPPINGYEI